MKALALASIFTIMAICPAWSQQSQMYHDRAKITVNGEAVVNVKPDKILLTFGIETRDANSVVAKQKNNDILKKALAAIMALGVSKKDIQTDHLSILPKYKNDYRKEEFIGYFAQNTFVATLTETEKVERLVTKVLESGVNYIHGIDFRTTEFKKYQEKARELALKAAKEKAEKMAAVLGQSIGSPMQINENFNRAPLQYYSSWSRWGHGRSQGMSQNVVQNASGASGEMTDAIDLGKISIRANVTATFEMKP